MLGITLMRAGWLAQSCGEQRLLILTNKLTTYNSFLSRSEFQLPESASLSMSKQNLLLQLYNTIVIHPIRSPNLDSTTNLLHRTVLVLVAGAMISHRCVRSYSLANFHGRETHSNRSVSVSRFLTVSTSHSVIVS